VHYGTKAELGVCRGALIRPKAALLISDVFTAFLSLMKHVKTVNGSYLPKESFYLTVSLKKMQIRHEKSAIFK
jgi:hypothetical protein